MTEPGTKPPRRFIPQEIPLGDGTFARLVLPADMTTAEADRLCTVIHSLAFTEGEPDD